MTIRNLMLCGAAGIFLAATPVRAQSIYTHEPTPEERVQTNTLNTQSADRARADTDASIRAQSSYETDRERYERSLDDYRANRDAYDRELARRGGQSDFYARERLERWRAFADYRRFHSIYGFHSEEMIGQAVFSRTGEEVGPIRDVSFTFDGRVERVAIDIGIQRTAWIFADDIRYDPVTRNLLTDLSRDQVWRVSQVREVGT